MIPKQIIQAYTAIEELTGIILPYHITRQLAGLKRSLGEEFHVISEMETSLRKKHGGVITSDNRYRFTSAEERQAFSDEWENFLNEEDDTIQLPPIDLSNFVDKLQISVDALTALENIIQFEKEAENG